MSNWWDSPAKKNDVGGLLECWARMQGSLGRISSATASPQRTTHLLVVLGTTRNKFTCSGNNWFVGQIVNISAWCREKGKRQSLGLLNIMESGHSYMFLCSRYVLCWHEPDSWVKQKNYLVLDDISTKSDATRNLFQLHYLQSIYLCTSLAGFHFFF